jgi:hypothetical protein
MTDMTIITNSVPRHTLDWHELTPLERADFDYIDPDDTLHARFVRYRGVTYDLHEFQSTDGLPEFSPLRAWQGHQSDSYFSGVVMRYVDDYWEQVVMGTFIA